MDKIHVTRVEGVGHLARARNSPQVFAQFISIDESMVGMKNRVVHLQYMPSKCHSRFELCDALTGYVLRGTLGVVCRQGLSHLQRYGPGARCRDKVVEAGQRPQQRLSPVHRQLLHEASVGRRAECFEHFVDRHSTRQLEGPTCAARPARHRRELELPQWRHAAGSGNYHSGDMLLVAATTAVATCCW